MTIFLRALETENKAEMLRTAIHSPTGARSKNRFDVDPKTFAAVPRSPFAYWVSDRLRSLFKFLPAMESPTRTARIGLSTSDDFRFLRLWWAVSSTDAEQRWVPFAKGGKFSPFYADVYLAVNWKGSGHEMKAWVVSNPTDPRTVHWSRRIANVEYYFRPGLSWPLRTQSGLAFRAMPAGCIFGHKGPSIFMQNDSGDDLLALLSVVNTKPFGALVELQMAFGSYEVGVIQRTPVPDIDGSHFIDLRDLCHRAWSLNRFLDARTECSHAFTLPGLLTVTGDSLEDRADAFVTNVREAEAELVGIVADSNQRAFDLFGMDAVDRDAITEGFSPQLDGQEDSESDLDAEDDNSEEDANAMSLAAELVSWAVGVAFGRFDVRMATGARALPAVPGPFDPLPVCSPAMLTNDDGLPSARAPAEYPISFPENGILVDDVGHTRDVTAAVRLVFDEVFKEKAETWWSNVGSAIDPKDQNLTMWLATSFFEYHLKNYSKSRRKAPIIWQLAVPSSRYSILLYAHRISRDSFFQIQNDMVTPKLSHEERQLATLLQSAGADPSASERKEIEAQETFIKELRALLDEVKRIAPLWRPTLDDGVALTMAPLWRLVPQNKPWQRELRSKWDALCTGDYDWAHLAMHLWPERVVPKCAADRSLAVAHGLEENFWFEDKDGKWKSHVKPKRSSDAIVQERASSVVKAALKSLLEAPVSAGGAARTRRSRAG